MISCTTNAQGEDRHEDPVIALLRDLFQLQHPPSACTRPSDPMSPKWSAGYRVVVEGLRFVLFIEKPRRQSSGSSASSPHDKICFGSPDLGSCLNRIGTSVGK